MKKYGNGKLTQTYITDPTSFYDFLIRYSPKFVEEMGEGEKEYLKIICDHLAPANQAVTECNQEAA